MNYFINKEMEYTFYLLELDGKIRMKKLGITQSLFSNETKRNNWYKEIRDNISDIKAIGVLNNLYDQMK